jgi:hypothetical protein
MGNRGEKNIPRLGKRPPRYRFFLNPYQGARFSTCPQCSQKTGQRKLPLFIHIEPKQPLLLNKTCRYCPHCDLLIAHKDELDAVITRVFTVLDPDLVGNTYLVLGTVDRADWKRIDREKLPIRDSIEALHDFKEEVIFRPMGGWRK